VNLSVPIRPENFLPPEERHIEGVFLHVHPRLCPGDSGMHFLVMTPPRKIQGNGPSHDDRHDEPPGPSSQRLPKVPAWRGIAHDRSVTS
jgi:hypothetical protein